MNLLLIMYMNLQILNDSLNYLTGFANDSYKCCNDQTFAMKRRKLDIFHAIIPGGYLST